MKPLRLSTPQSVELVEVIRVVAPRGAGVEGDPIRLVVQYWDKDGMMLSEFDSFSQTTREDGGSAGSGAGDDVHGVRGHEQTDGT